MADGSGERERERCEKEAALLLTPPSLSPSLSVHPCMMQSVKAEEERSRRRSRRTAVWWESRETGMDEGIYKEGLI